MGCCPCLLMLAKTGVAPTISPASASVIASFNLPGTASPPWYLGAREIRTFVRCVQGFRAGYWAETAVPANWQRATPAIEYSSPRNETLTVPVPVGDR